MSYTEQDMIAAKAILVLKQSIENLKESIEHIQEANMELQKRLLYMEGYNEFLSMKIHELKGEAPAFH